MKPVHELDDPEFEELVRRAAAMPDAPPAWVRAAVDRWQVATRAPIQEAIQEAAKAVAQRITAVLSFDSWGAPVAHGMRSVPSESRHLLFSAMGRDIDIRVAPDRGQFAVSGQVLGPDESGEVKLVARSADAAVQSASRVAVLDELGEFRLDGIARGTYLMTVRVGADEIELPPIEVGERRE